MASTEDEPIRLATRSVTKRSRLPIIRRIVLPEPRPIEISFILSLARRRSTEKFGAINFVDLATWLYYCSSVQSFHSEDANRQQRFVASFGALHPAHILLGDPNGEWFTYVAEEHVLGEIAVSAQTALNVRNTALQLYAAPQAMLVCLVSDLDLVERYYDNARGLILRDAGVLFGHCALVAAALGIGFRILGSMGSEQIVLDAPFRAAATGLAWIGSKEEV